MKQTRLGEKVSIVALKNVRERLLSPPQMTEARWPTRGETESTNAQ